MCVCVWRNITPSIHHCEKRRCQNPWQFCHKTAEGLCVVETIAFLQFFCLCLSCVAAPVSRTSLSIHLSGRGGGGSHDPTLLPFSFLKGIKNGGYSGQIIVMNVCLCAQMHTFLWPYLFSLTQADSIFPKYGSSISMTMLCRMDYVCWAAGNGFLGGGV